MGTMNKLAALILSLNLIGCSSESLVDVKDDKAKADNSSNNNDMLKDKNNTAVINEPIFFPTNSDKIPSDTKIIINEGETSTNNTIVNLSLVATDANQMYITNNADCTSGGTWESFARTKIWTLEKMNDTSTIYVKFRNGSYGESPCINTSIEHDTIPPTGISVSLKGGATVTNSTDITLDLSATDASEMYITDIPDCLANGVWENYSSSRSWIISQINGTATVYVKFRDSAQNESPCVVYNIAHDDIAPSGTSININDGDSFTSDAAVNLSLAAVDATEMYITNNSDCRKNGAWEAYKSSKTWMLGQTNNTANVYVTFRDRAGNESPCIDSNIIHDNRAPSDTNISINGGNGSTNETDVILNLLANGASEMYITNTAGCMANGIWESNKSTKNWTLAQTNNTATVYMKFRDDAGNESACINDDITHDDIPPSGVTISINGGASMTNDISVTLNLSAFGASEMYITNTAGCMADGAWEAYNTSKTWSLGQTNSFAAVYVKFRDEAGNESACISDNINHDEPPIVGGAGAVIETGATSNSIDLTWTKASDLASPQEDLSYCVYYSELDITTIAQAEAASLAGSCTNDIDSFSVSGLLPGTTYYFNIIVKDSLNNKALYSSWETSTASAIHLGYSNWVSSSSDLKYATNKSGSFVISTVVTNVPQIEHMDFDIESDNTLHFSYYDSSGSKKLEYVRGTPGNFTSEIIPTTSDFSGIDHSLDIEDDGTAHLIYTEKKGKGKKTLHYTSGTIGNFAAPELIAGVEPSGDIGDGIDVFIDADGIAHFTYSDGENDTLAYGMGNSGAFTLSTVELGHSDPKAATAIAEAEDGTIHTVYYDGSSILYENNDNNWNGSSTIVVATAHSDDNIDIALDQDEKVHACYRDTQNDLTYYLTNASGAWVSEIIYAGNDGAKGYLTCSIGVGSARGMIHIVYYTSTDSIRYTSGSAGSWQDQLIDSDAEPEPWNHKLIVE